MATISSITGEEMNTLEWLYNRGGQSEHLEPGNRTNANRLPQAPDMGGAFGSHECGSPAFDISHPLCKQDNLIC